MKTARDLSASFAASLPATLAASLAASLAAFASATRLYELTFEDDSLDLGSGGLLVEAFLSIEELQTIGARDIIVLLTSAHFELALLLR